MQIIPIPHAVPDIPGTVVALGAFDGVHLGHAALLRETVQTACKQGLVPAVFTFADDPGKGAPTLTTMEDRMAEFQKAGIKLVFTVHFSQVRQLTAEQFVAQILLAQCHAKAAVCGFNFRFGQAASGTSDTLLSLLPSSHVLQPVIYQGQAVSSSRIRAAIGEGDVRCACALLGRPYTVSGKVLHGKALGRTIGFPTINMKPLTLLPKSGVYATRFLLDGESYLSMTDIGTRPTVEGKGEIRMETHIPHFEQDVYGKTVSVAFWQRLRDEIAFSSIDELKRQLEKDKQALASLFSATEG